MAARPAPAADARRTGERRFRTRRFVSEERDRCVRAQSSRTARQSGLSTLGLDDSFFVDEEMADPIGAGFRAGPQGGGKRSYLRVGVFALRRGACGERSRTMPRRSCLAHGCSTPEQARAANSGGKPPHSTKRRAALRLHSGQAALHDTLAHTPHVERATYLCWEAVRLNRALRLPLI